MYPGSGFRAINGGQIYGDVTLGSATHHHQGPVNLSQFGVDWMRVAGWTPKPASLNREFVL